MIWYVIPPKAEINRSAARTSDKWVPAFAGTTTLVQTPMGSRRITLRRSDLRHSRWLRVGLAVRDFSTMIGVGCGVS
jgi:hypothetical protein